MPIEYGPGDPASQFNLKDQAGEPVMLYDFYQQSALVLFFYSKDDSPHATADVGELNDALGTIRAAGADVVGIGPDGVASHRALAEKLGLGYRLLSDDDQSVAREFGAVDDATGETTRMTFVIDREGLIQRVFKHGDAPRRVDEVLAAV